MPLLRLSEPFFFDVVKQEISLLLDKVCCRSKKPDLDLVADADFFNKDLSQVDEKEEEREEFSKTNEAQQINDDGDEEV